MKSPLLEWGLLAVLVLTAIGAAIGGSPYLVQTVFNTTIAVLLAIGWNIIGGFTGYVSFGQVSFFGLGAYLAAIGILHLDLPWYVAMPGAVLLATAVAVPLGITMLRLNGIFFALGMFGLARIFQIIATSLTITGGPMGQSLGTAPSVRLCLVVALAVTCLSVAGTFLLVRRRFGLRLQAIKDDAVAAQAAGISVAPMRTAAFAISAAVAAAAGGLYVWNVGYLDPGSAFNGTIELQTILIVLAGGLGTVWGPVIGGVLISIVSTFLWARFPVEQQVVLGTLIILLAVVMPGGIVGLLNRAGLFRRPIIWAATRTAAPFAPAAVPAAANGPVLRATGLTKRYGGLVAVNNVDLELAAGEMLAVIGPNGAGKSTLFNVISGFTGASAGQVELRGRRLTASRPELLAKSGIARTFQTSRLFRNLTVWETVLLASTSRHDNRPEACAAAWRLLDDVGLAGLWAELPERLSPGQQRLLEIARALALEPRVLLLDEAMAGMSEDEIARVHEALRRVLREGCAIVAIEHVLPAIAPLAARVQVLDFGCTVAVGIPYDVINDPTVISAYLGNEDEMVAHAG